MVSSARHTCDKKVDYKEATNTSGTNVQYHTLQADSLNGYGREYLIDDQLGELFKVYKWSKSRVE